MSSAPSTTLAGIGSGAAALIVRDRFYIDGGWLEPLKPARTQEVINPATEQAVGRISLGTPEDADRAVNAARAAFDRDPPADVATRVRWLERMHSLLLERAEQFAQTICREMGCPIKISREQQVGAAALHVKSIIDSLKVFPFDRQLGGALVVREPIGVCAMITPWNWPLNQVVCKVAAALAAGCTMVLKPSEFAPLSAALFADVVHDAGVPAGVFNLVNGLGPEVGDALARHPLVDMISITGSTRAGSAVQAAAAATIKRVTQELGGKSANIVLDDADLAAAVKRCVFTVMANSGQTCLAPTRLLVPNSRVEEASAVARSTVARLAVGDPEDVATFVGPVVSKAQFQKIQDLIETGTKEGARVVCGGTGKPEGLSVGHYCRPTVFAGVTPRMRIAREEIFGPVLVILGYADEEEAVRIANDSDYGLAGYVSSGDPERARRVARRIRAGYIVVNKANFDFRAPFGGYKQSGNGREWGEYGIEDFLEIKSIIE